MCISTSAHAMLPLIGVLLGSNHERIGKSSLTMQNNYYFGRQKLYFVKFKMEYLFEVQRLIKQFGRPLTQHPSDNKC